VAGKNKEIVMALREIAAGIVTAENIKDFTKEKLAKKHVDEVSEEEEGTENSH
jgi:hypothetical protein